MGEKHSVIQAPGPSPLRLTSVTASGFGIINELTCNCFGGWPPQRTDSGVDDIYSMNSACFTGPTSTRILQSLVGVCVLCSGHALTPSLTESPPPTPIESHASAPAIWSIVGAGLVVLVLFIVQVLTCVGLNSHCKEMRKSIQESAGLLFRTIPFWCAQATLAVRLISVCFFFRYETMWGIVGLYAVFVVWCVVLAWFVAFQTDPVSDRFFCCCGPPPAAVRPQVVVCFVVWLAMPLRWLLGRH